MTLERTDVAVIGAGLAGCAAAHRLRRLGHRVILFEADDHLGGRAWTLREGGFTIDTGASILLSVYGHTLALIGDLGKGDELVTLTGKTGFHDGRELHLLRLESPPSYLRLGLLSWWQRARLAVRGTLLSLRPGPRLFDLDSLADADGGETIAAWARRNFGEAGYQYVVRPNVEGLAGVSCEEASAATAIALFRAIGMRGVRILALRQGIDSLCGWLSRGAEVRLGQEVDALDARGDRVVLHAKGDSVEVAGAIIATDAGAAARLLPRGAARDALQATPYAANLHVALAYEEDPWSDAPADAVLPVGPGEQARGTVTLLARKSPSLVPAGAQVANVYFGDHAARSLPSDAEAIAGARATTEKLLGLAPSPLFARVFRRPRAVPVHRPGGFARLLAVRQATPPRVRLAGDYLFHETVEAALRSGEHAACELAEELG